MTNSLRTLLTEIIDYAGLFPPSEVSMAIAVKNYSDYLKSENSWMLGRFIVPVGRLDEFSAEAEKFVNKKTPWRLSVLASNNLTKTVKKVSEFNETNIGKAAIETLELKVETSAEIYEAAKILPRTLTSYFEIPAHDVLSEFITALALTKHRAKIRTGGITQDAFPSTDAIIKFMRICAAANIPFKATAGLHHPLRCTKPLTYEEDAPTGMMHGFLNVFLSACFLRQDVNNSFVHKLINETDASKLEFADEGILWKEHAVLTQTIETVRVKNAVSFGSCSFLEPIEDLQNLGLF